MQRNLKYIMLVKEARLKRPSELSCCEAGIPEKVKVLRQKADWLPGAGMCYKGRQGILGGMMEMFYIWTVMLVTQLYTFRAVY